MTWIRVTRPVPRGLGSHWNSDPHPVAWLKLIRYRRQRDFSFPSSQTSCTPVSEAVCTAADCWGLGTPRVPSVIHHQGCLFPAKPELQCSESSNAIKLLARPRGDAAVSLSLLWTNICVRQSELRPKSKFAHYFNDPH